MGSQKPKKKKKKQLDREGFMKERDNYLVHQS